MQDATEPIVYCLVSTTHPTRIYTGYTANSETRLLQHNGLLRGGARSTRRYRPWTYYFKIIGFKSKAEARSFEYKMKHRRVGVGPEGRLATYEKLKEPHLRLVWARP